MSRSRYSKGYIYIVAVPEKRRQVLCTSKTLEICWASNTL